MKNAVSVAIRLKVCQWIKTIENHFNLCKDLKINRTFFQSLIEFIFNRKSLVRKKRLFLIPKEIVFTDKYRLNFQSLKFRENKFPAKFQDRQTINNACVRKW